MAEDRTDSTWWENRPYPNSIVWDLAEGVALVVTIWAFWEIAKLGKDDGGDCRYE